MNLRQFLERLRSGQRSPKADGGRDSEAPCQFLQAATLGSAHPLAFIVFIFPGGFLVAAGIVLFLWAIASA